MNSSSWVNLPSLSLPVKTLFTGYIMVVGLGLLMAGGQIMMTHGMADGKLGLSIDDVVYSYYGNRNGSKLESKLNGSMKAMAPAEKNLELIKWARNGAPENEWEPKIQPIVDQYCVKCHAHMPGLPNVGQLATMKEVAKVDEGAEISALTRVSHIHLFGISFIFFFVGMIFSMAVGIKPIYKAIIIFIPFAFLAVDIAAWWLTKMNPNFAVLVIVGGFGYSLASTFMLFTSLYQMWWMPFKGKTSDENTWTAR